MAAFINNDITTAGLIVLAKGVAGQKINYTKIVLGDGYLEEGQTPRTLTGVVSPKATVDITFLSTPSARRATAKTETKSLFSNKLYNILHEFRRALIYNGSKNYPNHAK